MYLNGSLSLFLMCNGSLVFISVVPDSDGDDGGHIWTVATATAGRAHSSVRQLPCVWPVDITVRLHSHVLHLQFTTSLGVQIRGKEAKCRKNSGGELPNVICERGSH